MVVHLICQNDMTEGVVIGSESFAMEIMADMKKKSAEQIRKNYGAILAKEYIDMEYWHVHTCGPVVIEGSFPNDEKWDKIKTLVENQKVDERLWESPPFRIKPKIEAGLQEALHKLHKAVEE